MKHKEHYREKDGGIQAIVSYKYDDSTQWKTKSKQGFKKISDAKRWASSMIVELADGEGRQLMDENMTLGDAVELFLASKSYLTYNSQLAYKNALKQFTPYFNTKLSALNAVKTQSIAALVSSGHHRNVKIFWNYLEDSLSVSRFL